MMNYDGMEHGAYSAFADGWGLCWSLYYPQ